MPRPPSGGPASPRSTSCGAPLPRPRGATATPWWPSTAISMCSAGRLTTRCPTSSTATTWTPRAGRWSSLAWTARCAPYTATLPAVYHAALPAVYYDSRSVVTNLFPVYVAFDAFFFFFEVRLFSQPFPGSPRKRDDFISRVNCGKIPSLKSQTCVLLTCLHFCSDEQGTLI